MAENESMPCPRCGKLHKEGPYVPRPELAKKPLGDFLTWGPYAGKVRAHTPFSPADVQCECGATLRSTVPLFNVDVYGWHWRIL
jgi:hypothetical protein